MPTRAEHMAANPSFPWLSADAAQPVVDLVTRLGWLADDERITAVTRAGEGNMNLTLRVATSSRTFILKQARPWVEKYDVIPAPWERVVIEHAFYQRVADWPEVATRMPALVGFDEAAKVLALEDLGEAADYTFAYDGKAIAPADLVALSQYLRALHDRSERDADAALANPDMRALNHEHMYRFPLDPDNGLSLDAFEPGLADAAAQLQADAAYHNKVTATGERYLTDGSCLLHGDFFPGSWLRTDAGPKVIDPEFCFFGDRMFDLGVVVAHMCLAAQPAAAHTLIESYGRDAVDSAWLSRYAACEIMRRLIGVAQLPIAPSTDGRRAALLRASRQALLDESLEPLFT